MILYCGCGAAVEVDEELLKELPEGKTFSVTCLNCHKARFDRVEAAVTLGREVLDTGSENN